MRRRPILRPLALLALALALTGCARRQSDEDRIRTLFAEAARAAEEKRVSDVVGSVADDFHGHGLDKRGLKQLVAFHVLRGSWVAVTLGGDEIAIEGDTARAVVDAVMVRSGPGRAIAELLPEQASVHRLTLELRKADGDWEVTTATWRPVTLDDAAAGPAAGARR